MLLKWEDGINLLQISYPETVAPWGPVLISGCPFCVCSVAQLFQLFVASWAVGHEIPLSMGFLGQEYWSGLQCPPPEDLPDPGIEPESPVSPRIGRWILYH